MTPSSIFGTSNWTVSGRKLVELVTVKNELSLDN